MDFLKPFDGPVVVGRESEEVVYAKDQPQYEPLRTLPYETYPGSGDYRVMSRWSLTPEQRRKVSEGSDIFLTLLTFGQPLQPILMALGDNDFYEEYAKRARDEYPQDPVPQADGYSGTLPENVTWIGEVDGKKYTGLGTPKSGPLSHLPEGSH